MNQSLQTSHPYPPERTFVLKLHRDADLAVGDLRGRIVHLVSDKRADYADAASLLSCLQDLILISLQPHRPVDASPD